MLTVWKCQDWLWRLAAIVGLAYAVFGVYFVHIEWADVSFPGMPPQRLDNRDIASAAIGWLVILCCWLPMLRWRRAAWLWAALWASPWAGLGILGLRSTLGLRVSGYFLEDLILYLGPLFVFGALDYSIGGPPLEVVRTVLYCTLLISSQIWLVWEAHRVARTVPEGRRISVSGSRFRIWRLAGWAWRVFMLVGASIGLGISIPDVWVLPGGFLHYLSYGDGVETIGSALLCIWALALSGMVVLTLLSLVSSGRGFRFWLITWGLAPLLLWFRLARPSAATGEDWYMWVGSGSAFTLLAASQIWVAWKARQLGQPVPGRFASPSFRG